MKPLKYRKKPVEIEAMQLTSETQDAVIAWMRDAGSPIMRASWDAKGLVGLAIKTLEGEMVAHPGDWIIRGVEGEFYPCKDSIFRRTYEAPKASATEWEAEFRQAPAPELVQLDMSKPHSNQKQLDRLNDLHYHAARSVKTRMYHTQFVRQMLERAGMSHLVDRCPPTSSMPYYTPQEVLKLVQRAWDELTPSTMTCPACAYDCDNCACHAGGSDASI